MLSGASPLSETQLPPHPPRVPNHQLPHYTIEDHKRDVKVRSAFLSSTKSVILAPLQLPPHPLVVKKWLSSKTTTTGHSESKAGDVTMTTSQSLTENIKEKGWNNGVFTPVTVKRDTSQLEGPTPQNSYGFKISQSAFAASSDMHEVSM